MISRRPSENSHVSRDLNIALRMSISFLFVLGRRRDGFILFSRKWRVKEEESGTCVV